MARMLQALKNLEAKEAASSKQSTAAAATGSAVATKAPVATPATTSKAPMVAMAATRPSSAAPVAPRIIEVMDRLDAVVGHELGRTASSLSAPAMSPLPDFAFTDFAFWGQPETGSVVFPPLTTPAPSEQQAKSPPTAIVKAPSELERQVQRALGDALRREPLMDLVERLARDMEQTESKVLTFVSLGAVGSRGVGDDWKLPVMTAAVVLAEKSAKRVLLIDGDLARGSLSKALAYGRDPGLSEVVTGKIDIKSTYQPTATAALSFVSAGQPTIIHPTAVEALEQLPGRIKSDFDCVLIDAGGGWDDPACSALACASDATYLVVELGAVEMAIAQAALARLRSAGARVLGCIAI